MSYKKYFALISIYWGIQITNTYSQSYILYGDKSFGGNNSEANVRIIPAGASELILAGSSDTYINGDKTAPLCDSILPLKTDIWILKIDTAFNIKWNKSIGGQREEDSPNLVLNLNNQDFFITCTSSSDSICEKSENNLSFPSHQSDYWICMVDLNGNIIWDKTFGGTNGDEPSQIIQLKSGNLIIYGGSMSPVSGDKTVPNYNSAMDYWIVKLDYLGNKIWDKVFGGTGTEFAQSSFVGFNSSILPESNDDAFILAGTTNSPLSGDISDTSRGGNDIWIVKIDSLGNKIWDKRYGGSGDDKCQHIIHTDDKGYILCGVTTSPKGGDVSDSTKGAGDCWIIKLDSLGNKQWDKRYGGNDNDGATWIEKAPGGGYLISGSTGSSIGFDVTENKYGIAGDYWIFKIDNSGNKIWDKRFGGPGNNWGSYFVVMPDSSIFLVGNSDPGISPVKTDSGKGNFDYWLVHFKYTDDISGIHQTVSLINSVNVYPNPANDFLWIHYNVPINENIEFTLFTAMGQKIISKKLDSNERFVKIATDNIGDGIYFWKADFQNKPPENGKIILVK